MDVPLAAVQRGKLRARARQPRPRTAQFVRLRAGRRNHRPGAGAVGGGEQGLHAAQNRRGVQPRCGAHTHTLADGGYQGQAGQAHYRQASRAAHAARALYRANAQGLHDTLAADFAVPPQSRSARAHKVRVQSRGVARQSGRGGDGAQIRKQRRMLPHHYRRGANHERAAVGQIRPRPHRRNNDANGRRLPRDKLYRAHSARAQKRGHGASSRRIAVGRRLGKEPRIQAQPAHAQIAGKRACLRRPLNALYLQGQTLRKKQGRNVGALREMARRARRGACAGQRARKKILRAYRVRVWGDTRYRRGKAARRHRRRDTRQVPPARQQLRRRAYRARGRRSGRTRPTRFLYVLAVQLDNQVRPLGRQTQSEAVFGRRHRLPRTHAQAHGRRVARH